MDPVEKKKRGRKPKEQSNTDDPVKAKRGRKPKNVYNALENAPQQSISDDENIIVRLNIKSMGSGDLSDDEHPTAYDQQDTYCNIADIVNPEQPMPIHNPDTQVECGESIDSRIAPLKVVKLLKDFEEKNKVNEWPQNTSVACYWCCHRFHTPPFGIPVNIHDEVFHVYGCFCSIECAAAYNFKMHDSIDEMWERYHLMNILMRRLDMGDFVTPAPDRLALKMFGGFMDIDEFRNYFKSNKLININFPPMTSLTQQIEEINDYEIFNDYKYIPVDHDRIDRHKVRMFKRNKPLVDFKHTLESSMNLTVTS